MERHLLAISGSGFSEEENAYIDQFLLKLCQKTSPIKICFIATASDDAPEYIEKFYKQFQSEESSHLSIEDLHMDNIQEIVNSFDVVYIGGGNTYRMMQIWKQAGFDHVIRNAYECGVIICGVSAGAICWFEDCYSKKGDSFTEFRGLAVLKGSFCPHYDSESRREAFDQWETERNIKPVYKLNDNESIHFINEEPVAKITT
ncbi:peptidase E [Bacillus sp. AGMB 02131]|uniref:Peptidase E n=1 Tax=Peribacillus faecalis TaxID=2772559 RepID=A0A927CY92_9BACI|nr:peptidase E [Peribacillus faecalis]MBD3109846.1 peptidase E [Peribacillus faecalis]